MLITVTVATQKYRLKMFQKGITLENLKNDHTRVSKQNHIQDPKKGLHSGF